MDTVDSKIRDICSQLFDIGALKFGDFKMKVGLNSPVYFDLRVVISYPPLMEAISDLILEQIKSKKIPSTVICGVPYTALPFSTIVSIKYNKPMLIRRKEQKKYGTMKLIEGNYSAGDNCLIIEDVVTTGSSILETAQDLRHDGLVVKDVMVVIDRGQGGLMNLENNGITMHPLLTLPQALNILESIGKIDKNTVEKTLGYLNANQILPDGQPVPNKTITSCSRQSMRFGERASRAECPLAQRLFNLMELKKTNLCIAVDVPLADDLLKIAQSVGEHCAVIKTHFDLVSDWSEATEKALLELARTHNFIIMEDRKYSDIGNTVKLQMDRVVKWADTVTMHSIAGPSFIPHTSIPLFLLAQMSSADNLISSSYTQATIDMGEKNKEKVAGFVCQDGVLIKSPGFVHLCPGVSAQKGNDSLGQQYITPEEAVLVKGADLVVVGRAIVSAPSPQIAAKELRDRLWTSYEKRVGTS